MPNCHLCGRATVLDDAESDYSVSNVNICTRAGCEPEREYHKEQRNGELMDHWAILSRFKQKANRSRGGA